MHNIKDFDFKWAGAYEEQFNVRLFNTAVRLATETTEAHKENPALLQKLAGRRHRQHPRRRAGHGVDCADPDAEYVRGQAAR